MNIRKGMWVLHAGHVAIVASLSAVAAEIHFTDPQGCTSGSNVVALEELTQAKRRDIPANRRPQAKHAATLGYE